MGRFLTPSKIALLVLALIYTEGVIPLSGTPTVLNLLISRILLDSSSSSELLEQYDHGSILDLERALAGQPSAIPGRTVWNLLLKKLWAIDCADALDALITNLPSLLSKTREQLLKERDEGIPPKPAGKIVRTSPLGVFIRRCCLEYTRLQFQDSVAVWMDLIAYRMPTKTAYTRKNPHALQNALDVNLADMGIDASHPLATIMFRPMLDSAEGTNKTLSTYDVEKLMEFQVSEMQSLGGRLPPSMKIRLTQMTTTGSGTPKLSHYLKFLDSWRSGDYTSAFDSLHRYFDYTMQSRDRTFYQYALLNLAILQADFGNHTEAIPAMQEAIATARENRDTTCLNYCMSWLYHFGRAFPSTTNNASLLALHETGILGNEVEGLAFLKSRAKEAEMWTLLSTTLLSEAKLSLQHGESVAHVFENVTKATHINVVKSVPNCTGPALLLKSTVFSRIGQTHMAYSCGERFLVCHSAPLYRTSTISSDAAPLEDTLKCTLRASALLAQSGRLSTSTSLLKDLSSTHPNIMRVLKHKTHHTTHLTISHIRRLLHRNNLPIASRHITTLLSQTPHPDTETSFQIALLGIDLLTRQRNFIDALTAIENLVNRVCIENNDVLWKTKLMVLKAGLWAKGDKSLKGFSLTIRAIDMSYKARVLPVLFEAVVVLAHILNESYEFNAAKDLLLAILPGTLECQDCDLTGRLYLVLADCYVGLAGLAGNEDGEAKRKRKELIGAAMEDLEKSLEQFRWIEEVEGQLECLGKMGRICMFRGDHKLANELGERYAKVRTQYEDEEL